jgi:hypothetical protein
MIRPNSSQIEAAKAVVAKYGVDYRGVGTDLHQNTAVMAIYAILLGRLNAVPADYAACTVTVQLTAAPDDITGKVDEDLERGFRISQGIETGPPEGMDHADMVRLSDTAAELLGVPAGAYLHVDTVDSLVEEAQSLGNTNPDHNDDPADSDQQVAVPTPKADLDAMTIDALRAFAVEKGIDLQDIRLKADIIAAIREFGY